LATCVLMLDMVIPPNRFMTTAIQRAGARRDGMHWHRDVSAGREK
jgi:hypothetical protein